MGLNAALDELPNLGVEQIKDHSSELADFLLKVLKNLNGEYLLIGNPTNSRRILSLSKKHDIM